MINAIHIDQLFATLAADPETKALKEKVDAKAKRIEAHDATLIDEMIEEFKAKIKSFDIQKEADARLQAKGSIAPQ